MSSASVIFFSCAFGVPRNNIDLSYNAVICFCLWGGEHKWNKSQNLYSRILIAPNFELVLVNEFFSYGDALKDSEFPYLSSFQVPKCF